MIKKLALLLAIALVFSLTACGEKPADDKAEKKSEKVETKSDDEAKVDPEKKEEKKLEASKETGMIEISGRNPDDTPENLETLTDERIKEINEYFEEHEKETLCLPYEDVVKIIGTPGVHFVGTDDVDEETEELQKYIFWYGEDTVFYTIFSAEKDDPEEFGLDIFGIYDRTKEN